jgi:hypothetical protein
LGGEQVVLDRSEPFHLGALLARQGGERDQAFVPGVAKVEPLLWCVAEHLFVE